MNNLAPKIRDYQQEAIDAWVSNDYIGFFEMATGTGKTYTALYCAKYLLDLEGRVAVLILVPTLDLANQWKDNVKNIITRNIILANSKNLKWYEESMVALVGKENNSFCIITTYNTFLSKKFQYIVNKLPKETILIADEAHNFGTKAHIDLYPKSIERRLGLSATPARHFDEDGTEAMMAFFKAQTPTFQFNMEEAIKRGYLCEYYYYPIIVSLTDEELEEYRAISKKLAKYYSGKGFEDNPIVTALLLKRKRIVHNASEKFLALREIFKNLLNESKSVKYVLVYVPEGNDKNEDTINRKLINEYSRIISSEFGLNQHQFIGHTKDREIILEQFSSGKIDVLTAMKCLDEGVDIKRAETAIFCASTGNPRQFIQRRGRILRTHPNKKNAVIYDMIVVPAITGENFGKSMNMEKSILQGELRRVHEFASLSLNKYQALQSLEIVAKNYEIDIFSNII
ncbi:DEAD/DEAH box helicase family protein [Flavobacterium sp.]|uniref:DEAD/DEAH box helicase family protein n=1 Tax=Flavobacterium sp. TaxID=239 RepID=UPI00391C8E91